MSSCVTPGGVRRIRESIDGSLTDVSVQVLNLKTDAVDGFSAELNDGEAKVPASFAKSLAGKFAGVKTNAVLKLTDVRYAENKAFVTEFEFVEDSEAEFVSDASDAQASKKQKTAEGATATVTTSPTGSGKKIMSIASLNPYMGNWCVKAKLSLKGDVRTFRNAKGEGKVMTIELVDEAGTAIQATMWKDAIDSYDSILEVGKVFYVAKGTLRPANKQYSNCSNDYEMSLDGRCEIEVCTDSVDMSKMQRGYELVKIDSLAMKIGGRGSVDVLAVVQTVGELGAVRRKSDNEEIQRRDVTLVDDTGKSISLTLWNALAVEQGEQLSQMTNPIIAVRGLRVTDYNGVSLSTVARSELFIEPTTADIVDKVVELRNKFDPAMECVAAGAGLATARGPGGKGGPMDRLSLLQMQPDLLEPATANAKMAVVNATTCLIKADQPMYYAACPEEGNNKKVTEENGKWFCEATQKTYDTCRRRYIMRVKVQDSSGAGWVNVFHDQAVHMLGMEAEDMHKLRSDDPPAYERAVKRAQFNDWSLKLKSKTEEYNGESRRRLTVVHCGKPDYAVEAKHLLSLIQGVSA